MSYRDPYSGHYAAGSSGRYQTNQPQYEDSNSYPPYGNMGGDEYRPYDANLQSYRDERQPDDYQPDYSYGENQKNYDNYPPPQRGLTQKSTTSGFSKKRKPSVAVVPVRKQESGFEQGEFTPTPGTRK